MTVNIPWVAVTVFSIQQVLICTNCRLLYRSRYIRLFHSAHFS